ncbi:hypothetical protein [Clostridioides difficile]|nr:hypothetical protein [Clostridioides difficile]PBF84180.1 hypothetical protein BGU99_19010 [Clostridioides difficile]
MGILEGAAMIREIAIKIAKEKGITEQKAWPDARLLITPDDDGQ